MDRREGIDLIPQNRPKGMNAMNEKHQQIVSLYRRMPGAPQPPMDERGELWGEVEGNEHWEFCSAIVDQTINAAQAYSR